MIAHAIKHNKKPTATPPSTVIAVVDNHFLPPSDDKNDNYSDPADLMGKYDGGRKKKEKGGNFRRYRDDDEIEALHGLYKEPKDDNDDGCGDEKNGSNWDDMEEKEQEKEQDDGDEVVKITAVQLFGMPDKEFLGKDMENKKNKE